MTSSPAATRRCAVELAVGPFCAAVRQAAIVTSDERRGVDFTFGEGKVVLAAHGAEYGESHVELPIAYDGAGVAITLDPRYLSDFLSVLAPTRRDPRNPRRGKRRRLLHRGRLRLRDHAAGAGSLTPELVVGSG